MIQIDAEYDIKDQVRIKSNGKAGIVRGIHVEAKDLQYKVRFADKNDRIQDAWLVADDLEPFAPANE